MIEIALLGGVSVHVDGRAVEGEANQRKRLAVLSLLAAPPPGRVDRERLMAYVWPESGPEAARHLLCAAVHVLRKALGPDVIRSVGDQLELDSSLARVDAVAFEEAIRAADWEAAASLYGGPFLEGFHPGGSPDLEHWIDGQRARLERQYCAALREVAEARSASGDTANAVVAWQTLAALDPYAAESALGLMRAHAAAGNRAAAIQHARIHAQLLDSEFGADPDPEVMALAEALKVAAPEGAGAGDRGRPGQPVEEPVVRSGSAPPAPAAPAEASDPGWPPVSPLARRERRRWLPIAGGVLVVLAMAGLVGALGFGTIGGNDRPSAPLTIAVLPFAVSVGEQTEQYLGDGLAEQLLDDLGRIDGLRVVARASSFAFRGRDVDVREVGRAVGATHVVEGSVTRADDAVRIWVQLVEADSTGYQVWSETYDRPATRLFALQDEIAREVAAALEFRLRPSGRIALDPDVAAFDLYLRGRHAWLQRMPQSLEQARDLFARAVALDSSYAHAWVGLADAYTMLGSYDYGALPPTMAYQQARVAAHRALRLQPDLAPAHAALANIHMNYDWDWAAAEREFERALEINPGFAQARQWYALMLVANGRDAEAARQLQQAAELDPASPVMLATRAHFHFYRRDLARARAECEAALRLDPSFGRAHLLLALVDLEEGRPDAAAARAGALMDAAGPEPIVAGVLGGALAAMGDTAAARSQLALLEEEATRRYVPEEAFAIAWTLLGERDRAIRSLERAYELRSGGIVYLPVEPLADPLRSHPRFQRLLARRPG